MTSSVSPRLLKEIQRANKLTDRASSWKEMSRWFQTEACISVILQCKQQKHYVVHSPAPCNSALLPGWHAAVRADVSMNWQRGFTRRLLAPSQKQGSGRERGTDPEERDTASLPMTLISFTSPEIHIVYSQKHLKFPWIHNFMIIM